MAQNNNLKIKVNELEVINNLYKDQVSALESSETNARRSEMLIRDSEGRLRRSLEDSYKREDELKRKIERLEALLKDKRADDEDAHRAKKMRMSDMVQEDGRS